MTSAGSTTRLSICWRSSPVVPIDLPIGLLTTLRVPAENVDPIRLDRALGRDRLRRISLGPLDDDATMRII